MDTTVSSKIHESLLAKRAEAQTAWTEFEKLREDAKASGADLSKAENLDKLDDAGKKYDVAKQECLDLEAQWAKATGIEHRVAPSNGDGPFGQNGDGGGQGEAKSPGTRFVESAEYKALVASGVLGHDKASISMPPVKALDRAETKALITGLADASAGAFIVNQRLPGLLALLQRPIKVANLVNVSEATNDVVEWVKQDSFTNAAAETIEATSSSDGAKPESAMAFSVVSTPVQAIPHWIPVTRRALADVPMMRDLIDSQLRFGVELRLDSQMVNGNGTSPNLRGILNTSGIGTQAKGTDPPTDAVHKAMTIVRLAFMEPTAVLMHPTDYQTLRLAKDANSVYYYGPPNIANENSQLWGIPVVQSAVIAQGTALVGDFRQATLWVREGISVLATDSHSDFFIRNIIVVLAEGRFAFGVQRPAGFATVTGL